MGVVFFGQWNIIHIDYMVKGGVFMSRIEVAELTKDYGNRRGIFDVSFTVEKGEIFGFLGPNGAGKTTTIRHLMGFIKAESGSCCIDGMSCFEKREVIQDILGYLPGEPALMDEMTGHEFLQFMAKMKRISDNSKMEYLTDYFELEAKGKIKKMSKGMKQKLSIICAFMGNPEILLLDEPTSGLDPLMQNKFIDLLLEEKQKGTTVLLSSHIFEEVERTCDKVAFIRQGEIVTLRNMDHIRKGQKHVFEISFNDEYEKAAYARSHPEAKNEGNALLMTVSGDMDGFIKNLAEYKIADIKMRTLSLEEIFLQYYTEEDR